MVRRERSEPVDGEGPGTDRTGADEPGVDESGAEAMDADEALDREFGLDPHLVAPRTGRQLVRNVVVTSSITLVAAAVVTGTLFVTIQSVQNGIGGLFPQPGAALVRFEEHAARMSGVTSTADLGQRQTQGFSGYDVEALVTADPALSDEDQATLVTALSDAAQQDSGNGVQVLARVRFADITVGVSADTALSRRRLVAGQQVAAMGTVDAVSVAWQTTESGAVADSAAHQIARVRTNVGDDQLATVTAEVTDTVHATLPDAEVVVTRTTG
ncbi:hypothetical protein [Curtobacterium sp. RRHDQ10]|uniref:hypothetical protein n=1 Tax=Curtobacterium phyllosphaerae TaxID=3413379 RepID=UPI003BF1C8ED